MATAGNVERFQNVNFEKTFPEKLQLFSKTWGIVFGSNYYESKKNVKTKANVKTN